MDNFIMDNAMSFLFFWSFFICLLYAFSVTAIVGCGISLYHSLKEETRRNEFVVFSSIGLGCGIVGLFIPILSIPAAIMLFVSIKSDKVHRGIAKYVIIPIVVTIFVTILYVVGVAYLGYMVNDAVTIGGQDTLNSLGY